MRAVDLSRLRRGEWIVGVAAVVLLGSMLLLPWYGLTRISGPPGPAFFIAYSVDGWNGLTGLHWLMLVTILAAFALVFFQATRRAPAIPATFSVLVAWLGVLTALWLVFREFISAPGDLKIGAIVGLISLCAIAFGGWDSLHEEGIAARDGPGEIPTVSPGQQAAS
jgi:hypothetical protein